MPKVNHWIRLDWLDNEGRENTNIARVFDSVEAETPELAIHKVLGIEVTEKNGYGFRQIVTKSGNDNGFRIWRFDEAALLSRLN
jgi:hypothetical protein